MQITLPPDVELAIASAFGNASVDDIEVVSGGMSGASLYGFRVDGARYVVRRRGPSFDASQFVCMRIAAERGVAPKVVHVDDATGIAIMERVDGGPLRRASDGSHIRRLAHTLRVLHAGPSFPHRGSVSDMIAQFETMVSSRGHALPPAAVRTMNELATVTARFAEAAPCHHDLNPNNILDDAPAERVYFIDWEIARQGDPFIDLGQLGVFVCPSPPERTALLEAYLERAPTEEERARATLARVHALAGYVMAFSVGCALHGADAIADTAPLTMPELFAKLGAERERVKPNLVGASLLAQMEREAAGEACIQAKDLLSRSA